MAKKKPEPRKDRLSVKEFHTKVLYPVCRVRAEDAGGSGAIIYSKPDPKNPEDYQSFVLTNHHVVAKSIQTKEDWDSLLKKKVRKEVLSRVTVEVFDYVDMSIVVSSNSHSADIVAYDSTHDLALLKLDSPRKQPYVADLYPKDEDESIKLSQDIYACGASLLHEPFANPGQITYLREYIDDKLYWMSNANSIFGNSGGAVFTADTGQYIGVPSRVTTIKLGFAVDVVTWMGFFCPIPRIYEFFDEQELKFLYDDKDTYEKSLVRRKKAQRKAIFEIVKDDRDEAEGTPELDEDGVFPPM